VDEDVTAEDDVDGRVEDKLVRDEVELSKAHDAAQRFARVVSTIDFAQILLA
jgi:hypothetical protein